MPINASLQNKMEVASLSCVFLLKGGVWERQLSCLFLLVQVLPDYLWQPTSQQMDAFIWYGKSGGIYLFIPAFVSMGETG